MKKRKQAVRIFRMAFILTLLFCASAFGLYTSAVNTETRIKGENAAGWAVLDRDKSSLMLHWMGKKGELSLALPNQAAKAVQQAHVLLPREYRMAGQGKALVQTLLGKL